MTETCNYRHPNDDLLRCISEEAPVVITDEADVPGLGKVKRTWRYCNRHAPKREEFTPSRFNEAGDFILYKEVSDGVHDGRS